MQKKAKWMLISACLVFAVIVAVQGYWGFYAGKDIAKTLRTVTDVNDYGRIRNEMWRWPELIRHFPAIIPADAVETAFYYKPLYPQGGGAIQLKFSLPAQEIERLSSRLSASAKASYDGGDLNEHQKQPGGLATTHYFTGGSPSGRRFPADFKVIVIESKGDRDGSPLNHGESCGVAVSTQRNTVVYWAETW